MSINGRSEIQAKLKADSNVTALVDVYLTQPAIYSVPITPDYAMVKGAISMYLSTPIDGSLEFETANNTVNCWALDYNKAEALQQAVFASLNRVSENGNTFYKCSKQIIIPPQEISGEYNAPVEVLFRKR